MNHRARRWRLAALTLACLVGAACSVGPDYRRPDPDPRQGYGGATAATGATRVVQGGDVAGDWWRLFHDPDLDALIARALAHNPDLAAAEDGLRAAREAALASRGALLPAAMAGAGVSRQRTSAQLSPTPGSGALTFDLYTPQLTVSYVPDVFGVTRRSSEAMDAQADQARFALIAAHVALCGNVAAASIQAASLRAQLGALRTAVVWDREALALLRRQRDVGYASSLDVAAGQAQLAQAEAALPPRTLALAQLSDLLGQLTGGYPGDAPEPPALDALKMPEALPVSLPGRLVDQRPDVRQAEANLHAACARVGVAVADRLPVLTLTGDVGSMALSLSQLLTRGDAVWLLGASVAQPVFEGGALAHQERAASAAWAQAREQYRSTVIAAFANVADCLHALDQDQEALASARSGLEAARATLAVMARQQAAGYAARLSVLAALSSAAQAEAAEAQAHAEVLSDVVALLVALGGGWWNRAELSRQ